MIRGPNRQAQLRGGGGENFRAPFLSGDTADVSRQSWPDPFTRRNQKRVWLLRNEEGNRA